MQTLHDSELLYAQDHKLDFNGIAQVLLEDVVNTVMVDVIFKAIRGLYKQSPCFLASQMLLISCLKSKPVQSNNLYGP